MKATQYKTIYPDDIPYQQEFIILITKNMDLNTVSKSTWYPHW